MRLMRSIMEPIRIEHVQNKSEKMNFLLVAVNAKYIHSNLAVYSLKANAKNLEKVVSIGEYTINHREEYILEDIYKKHPTVLFFSCYIWNIEMVVHLIETYHQIVPDVPIWVGGPEVSYDASAFLQKYPMVRGVLVGEGEQSFYELCNWYETKAEQETYDSLKIRGVTYRKDDDTVIDCQQENGLSSPLKMDELKFCYHDLKEFENRIIYYESSRGCPFRCSYCLSSIEKQVRFRSIDLVEKELEFFVSQNVKQVKFVDRTFNCNHEHAMNIWKWILEHDNGRTNFHFEISADLLQEEEVELLSKMRPGLIQLEIGVQSTYEKTIQEVSRHMNLQRVEEAVLKLQKPENIHLHLDLIAGLPYEGLERFKQSFNEIYALHPEQLQLGFLKILKGSHMEEMASQYGMIYNQHPPYEILATKWLSYEELILIKKVEEMLELYGNSGQYETVIKFAESLFDHPFDMFEKLGTYYESNELRGISLSRLKRTEVLLDFLKAYENKEEDFFCEAATYDLYLRENAKKHPDFAKNQNPYKERLWKLAHSEAYPKTAHFEVFSWDFSERSSQKGEYLMLFDYENRSKLTNQATVTVLNQKMEENV